MKYIKVSITMFFVVCSSLAHGMWGSRVAKLPATLPFGAGSLARKSFTADQLTSQVPVKTVVEAAMSSTMLSTYDYEVNSPQMAKMQNIWLNLKESFDRVDQSFLRGKELALGVEKDVVGKISTPGVRLHKSSPFMAYLQFSHMLGGSSVAGSFLPLVTKWKVIPHNFDLMISSLPARTQLSTIADCVAESQTIVGAVQDLVPAAMKAQFHANDVIRGAAAQLSSAQQKDGIAQVLAQAVAGQAAVLLPELSSGLQVEPSASLESRSLSSLSDAGVISAGQVEILGPINAVSVVEGLVVPSVLHDISVPDEQKIFVAMSHGILNPANQQACVDFIVRLPGMQGYKDALAARMSMMRKNKESVTQAVVKAIKGSVIEDVSASEQQLNIVALASTYQEALRKDQPEKLLLTDRVTPVIPVDAQAQMIDEKFLLGAIQTVKYEQTKYEYVQNNILKNKTRLFFTRFFSQPFGQMLLMMALFNLFISQDDEQEQSADKAALVKKDQLPFYDLFSTIMLNAYYAGIDVPWIPASYYDFKTCLFDALSLLGITIQNQEVQIKTSQAFQDLDQTDVDPEVVRQMLKEAQLIEQYTQHYTLMLQDVPLEKVLALNTTQPLLPQLGKLALVTTSSTPKSLPNQSQAYAQKSFAAVANFVRSLQSLTQLFQNLEITINPKYVELLKAENNAQLTARVQDITAQQTAAIQDTIKMYQFTQSPVAKSMVFNQLAYMLSLFGTMQNQAVKKHSIALLEEGPKQEVAISKVVEGSHTKTWSVAKSAQEFNQTFEQLEVLEKQFVRNVQDVRKLSLSAEQKKTLNTIQIIQQQEIKHRFQLLESERQEREQHIQDATRDLAAIQAAQQKALQIRQQKTVETSTESQAISTQMQRLFELLHAYQNKLQELLSERNIKHVYDYDKQQWRDLWKELPEEIKAFDSVQYHTIIMGYLEGLLLADKNRVPAKMHTISEKMNYKLLQLLQNVQQIKKQRVYNLLQLLKETSFNKQNRAVKA